MNGPVPWDAPTTIGMKRRGETVFMPEVIGLRLNEALNYAIDPDVPNGTRFCIWVRWDGVDVVLQHRHIFHLARHPDRPASPTPRIRTHRERPG